jgi:NADPH:quinone reductase-like Zn-dependent oxidoreductase
VASSADPVERSSLLEHEMKAAVLSAYGTPEFGDFPDPQPEPGQLLVTVRAATINPVDVAITTGRHYLSPKALPVISGVDGVGILPDGSRVYFVAPVAPYGSMAQRTLVREQFTTPLPEGIDDAVAAVLGNAGVAALLPLSWRAALHPGESVLILGATGVVGRFAVQVARLLGAGVVVAAGRDRQALALAKELGADVTVALGADDPTPAFKTAAGGPVDVIIDYTWGAPAEAALRAAGSNTRLIQVGDRAGDDITVNAKTIRDTGAAILGFMPLHAGPVAMRSAYQQLVEWTVAGELDVEVEQVPLSEVATAWPRERTERHRLVLVP